MEEEQPKKVWTPVNKFLWAGSIYSVTIFLLGILLPCFLVSGATIQYLISLSLATLVDALIIFLSLKMALQQIVLIKNQKN